MRKQFYPNPLLQDTPVTPYTRPPVSADLTTRDRLRDCRNVRQFAVFHHIPPHSAKFCQVHRILPSSDRILPSSTRTMTRSLFCPVYVLTKQPSQRYIPFSPYSLTFLSLRNVLTLLRSLCTQLNNIYFAIYYHRLCSLRDTPLNRHINIFRFNGKRTILGRITYIVALRL